MSRNTSAVRRLSLLAGSSLIAAGLSAAASIGAAVLPSTAAAQSVCTPTPTTGAGTNVVGYANGSPGVTCTATGALTINLTGVMVGLNPTNVGFVNIGGAGTATINIGDDTRLQRLDANSSALTTLNVGPGGELGERVLQTEDFLVGQGSATGPIAINNNGRITGRFNLGSVTGPITIRNNVGTNAGTEGWQTGGVTTLGSGDDLIENAAEGVIKGPTTATINFGAGNDRLVNTGQFMTGVMTFAGPGLMTLTNLERFENSGLILLGSDFWIVASGATGLISDRTADDRLIALGTDFIGSGDSRIGLDVNLAEITQADCSANPVAADCIDFTGGTTSGSTLLTIQDTRRLGNTAALNDGMALIMGVSAASDFTLSPDSDFYVSTADGAGGLQKYMVIYRLAYDEPTKRLMLVGALADEALQPSTFAASVQETWRETTGTWLTRQADLRSTPGGLEGPRGAWVRMGTAVSERETTASYVQGSTTHDYDLAHKQQTSHLVIGADMVRVSSAEGGAVIGGMVGFVRSDVEFDASPTETIANGFTGGLYASYVGGPLFVDAVLNANLLHLKTDAPNMNLGIDVPLTQDVTSIGGQVEAGLRVDVGGRAFVEPLGGVAYVVTRIDDVDLPDNAGGFGFEDKYTSLRVGAGLRVGLESALMGMTSNYSLTGRYWRDGEGENTSTVTITNGATTVPIIDDFSGDFVEIDGGLNLYSESGAVSGFVNLGGKFADGYQSLNGSAGVRLRW